MPLPFSGKLLLYFGVICLLTVSPFGARFVAQAAWDGQYYEPGETLDPECAPTDPNCDVNPVVDAAHGGTGLDTYAPGDLLYAASADALGRLALGIDGKVLKIVGGNLAWADDTVGTAFTADGNGIELSGPTFSLELDGASLAKSADGLRLSATYAGQNTISTVGTITAGVWNGTAIADAFLTKSGDWTGTFDGTEGAAYLARANHTGTQTAATISDFEPAVADLLSTGNGLVVNGTAFGLVLDGNTLTKTIDGLRISAAYVANWDAAYGWGNHASGGYAKLIGLAGGQTLIGGTAANNTLVLQANSASGNTLTNTAIEFKVGNTGSTTAMTILNNGRVGIGTTGPTETLQISDIRTTPNSMGIYVGKTGAVSAGTSYGIDVDVTGASVTNVGAYFSARGATNNRSLWIPSNNTAGTNNYALYIEGTAQNYFAGNVGIGGAVPQQLLDLSSTQPVMRITNTTNLGGVAWAATEIAKIEFYSADASLPSVAASINVIGSADATGGVAPGDMAFFTRNNAGLLTEKMRVTDLGGVGIGTSAPGSYTLRLVGTRQAASGDLAVVSLENTGTSSADVLTLKQTGEVGSAESTFVNFFTNAGPIGNITTNGAGVVVYNTTSDRRLKDDIAETQFGIDDVLKIPVHEFTMRQDPKKLKQTGFIAQELAAVYPDAVSANGDDGLSPLNGLTPWSIDYGRLTPLLVKSIQDQQLLLGDIADKDGLSAVVADASHETPLNAMEYVSGKLSDGWRPLLNFAAARVTSIRGYFDEVFVRRSHQETLCVGTAGNETCLTKDQLDALLSGQAAAPAAPAETPPTEEDVGPPATETDSPPPAAE